MILEVKLVGETEVVKEVELVEYTVAEQVGETAEEMAEE